MAPRLWLALAMATSEGKREEKSPDPLQQEDGPSVADRAWGFEKHLCSKNPECHAAGLEGACCPTETNFFLECCPNQSNQQLPKKKRGIVRQRILELDQIVEAHLCSKNPKCIGLEGDCCPTKENPQTSKLPMLKNSAVQQHI